MDQKASAKKFTIQCPNEDCQKEFSNISEKLIGKKRKCPSCKKAFTITEDLIVDKAGGKKAVEENNDNVDRSAVDPSVIDRALRPIKESIDALKTAQTDIGESQVTFQSEMDQLAALVKEVESSVIKRLTEEQVKTAVQQGVEIALDPKIDKLKNFLEEIEEERSEIDLLSESRKDFIRRYQPGKIEELGQQLEQKQAHIANQTEELKSLRAALDDLEREVRAYKTSDSGARIDELRTVQENILAERQKLGSLQALKRDNEALRSKLDDLAATETEYEKRVRDFEIDWEMRRQFTEIESRVKTLEHNLMSEKAESGSLRSQNKDFAAKLSLWRKEAQTHQKELLEEKDRTTQLESRIKELEADRSRVEDKETELDKEKKDMPALLEKTLGKLASRAEAELDRRFAEREALLEQEKDALKEEKGAFKEKIEAVADRKWTVTEEVLEKEIADLKFRNSHLEQLRKNAIDDLNDAKSAMNQWELDVHKREAEVKQQEALIRDGKETLESIEERIENIKKERRELEGEVAGLQTEEKELATRVKILNEEIQNLRKFRSDMELQTTDRAARIRSIEKSLFPVIEEKPARRKPQNEMIWLADVKKKMTAAGFYFPDRLLYAFHTSLKIADFSQLTVLAGFSGTGKSELPRLYSIMGGIRFLPLAVQPNWDSPQDMFGFFNYLDGRYKATDFLRALVQSQRTHDEEGFREGMLIVLLDEMNIARPELYFSEMLSKLEMRRGMEENDGGNPQCDVSVDLGALDGEDESYPVKLGQNVLYVGTINEDETTLSLSDKVLDRGNVIAFPRPRKLVSRELTPLESFQSEEWLSFDSWRSWLQQPSSSLPKETRSRIRDGLQDVNEALQRVDRAIGHRVLQAIEMYVANHPLTISEPDRWPLAFADQMVQKIMPKLRGVEVESTDGERCLDGIGHVLSTLKLDIREDFEKTLAASREGAFVWSGGAYLEREI